MFNHISWGSYCLALTILLVLYYSVILCLNYSHEIKLLVKRYRLVKDSKDANDPPLEIAPLIQNSQPSLFAEIGEAPFPPSSSYEPLKLSANAMIDEIKAFLAQRGEGCTSEELFISIKQIASKYPSLKETSYQAAINQIIRVAYEDYCSIHLSAAQLSRLW